MAIFVGFIYLMFSAALLYAVLFVGDLGAPRMIDLGPSAPPLQAWLMDCTLLALLAFLHAGWIYVRSSKPGGRGGAARSSHAYALIAGLVLPAFFVAWRPLPEVIWSLSGAPASILRGLFYLGWTLVLIGALIGRARPFAGDGTAAPRRTRAMAEPTYPGLIVALWATPSMTLGHLLLAASATLYVLAAALLEERGRVGGVRVSPPSASPFASERARPVP